MNTRKMKATAAGLAAVMAVSSAAAPVLAEELPDEAYWPTESFNDEQVISDDIPAIDEDFIDSFKFDDAEILPDTEEDVIIEEADDEWLTVGIETIGQTMVYYKGKEGCTWADLMKANPQMPVTIIRRSNVFSPTGYIDMMMYEGRYRLAFMESDGITWVYPEDTVDFHGTLYMANTDQYYDDLMGW